MTWDIRGVSLDFFAKVTLGNNLERPGVNETEIAGLFHVHLEFASGETAAQAEPAGSSIFTELQEQLGLKLESIKVGVN